MREVLGYCTAFSEEDVQRLDERDGQIAVRRGSSARLRHPALRRRLDNEREALRPQAVRCADAMLAKQREDRSLGSLPRLIFLR